MKLSEIIADEIRMAEVPMTDHLAKALHEIDELQAKYDALLSKNAKLQTELNIAWSKTAFVGEGSFDGCGD